MKPEPFYAVRASTMRLMFAIAKIPDEKWAEAIAHVDALSQAFERSAPALHAASRARAELAEPSKGMFDVRTR